MSEDDYPTEAALAALEKDLGSYGDNWCHGEGWIGPVTIYVRSLKSMIAACRERIRLAAELAEARKDLAQCQRDFAEYVDRAQESRARAATAAWADIEELCEIFFKAKREAQGDPRDWDREGPGDCTREGLRAVLDAISNGSDALSKRPSLEELEKVWQSAVGWRDGQTTIGLRAVLAALPQTPELLLSDEELGRIASEVVWGLFAQNGSYAKLGAAIRAKL